MAVTDLSRYGNNGTFFINADGYYPFDGNATDASTLGNNGTVSGATLTTDHLGNTNNAYDFGLKTGRVDLGVITMNTTSISIEAWIYVTDVSSYISILDNEEYAGGGTTQRGFILRVSTSRQIQLGVGDKLSGVGNWGSRSTSTNAIQLNQWHHIVAVWSSGTTQQVYIDGVAQSMTGNIFTGTLPTITPIATIGGIRGTNNFNGKISSILIRNGVGLSAGDVTNLYNVTSVHKLNKPVITKADSNGNQITGYELWGESQSNADTGSFVTVAGTESMFESGDMTMFQEILVNSLGDGGTAYALNHYNWNFRTETSGTNNLVFAIGRMNDGSGPFYYATMPNVQTNRIYRCLAIYHPDAGGNGYIRMIVYSNGAQVFDSGEVSIGSDVIWTGYGTQPLRISNSDHGAARMFNGVITKPMVFNRVLTSTERTALFNGTFEREVLYTGVY